MPDILLREQQMRIKQLEDLLEQAHMIIKPEKNKVVYRAARQAWCEQYESLGITTETKQS